MTGARLVIDLDIIKHNASILLGRLRQRGIELTAVTKACASHPSLIEALAAAGIRGFGDSRIENIEAARKAGVKATIALIRSPMLSQCDRVVAHADYSLNTELDVIRALSHAANMRRVRHGVVLMVELGDLREGIMPHDLDRIVRQCFDLPNINLLGIGTNLGCLNGVEPCSAKMQALSKVADDLDDIFRAFTGKGDADCVRWQFKQSESGHVGAFYRSRERPACRRSNPTWSRPTERITHPGLTHGCDYALCRSYRGQTETVSAMGLNQWQAIAC